MSDQITRILDGDKLFDRLKVLGLIEAIEATGAAENSADDDGTFLDGFVAGFLTAKDLATNACGLNRAMELVREALGSYASGR